jgi:mannose-6-phosphate isomerase-like protein (cupin superfamily)
MKTSSQSVHPYVTKDGSIIRELMHPDSHQCNNLSLAVAEIEYGKTTSLHRHVRTEEIYHVISGEGMMTLGSKQFSITTGDTICIHPGVPHRVVNTGRQSLRIFCCCAPPYSHGDTEII